MARGQRSKTQARIATAVFAVGIVVLVTAMILLTGPARTAGEGLRRSLRQAGPPITSATLAKQMDGIPLAPGLTLDEAVTNAPTTRVVAGMSLNRSSSYSIAVFRSTVPAVEIVGWYKDHWSADESPLSRRHRDSEIPAWIIRKGQQRVLVAELPEYPGEVVLRFGRVKPLPPTLDVPPAPFTQRSRPPMPPPTH